MCVFWSFVGCGEERPDKRRSDGNAVAASMWCGSLTLLFAKKMPPRLHAAAYEKRPWKYSDSWRPAHLLLKMHTPHSRLRLRRNGDWLFGERWEFVSSHSSATASDSHGVPSHGRCFIARKELRAPCARHAAFDQVEKPAAFAGLTFFRITRHRVAHQIIMPAVFSPLPLARNFLYVEMK